MLEVGKFVTATYKTGEYIGEIAEPAGLSKVAVRILAVTKHPEQGNLHQPYNGGAVMFHQRKALAYTEIALIALQVVEPFQGAVPPYKESLRAAFDVMLAELQAMSTQWAERSLGELEDLRKEYQFE
ncbi:kinase-associated lipoprotein B [Paenibacillus sp. N1-5-1-14]|uniref:kinase-associated lipoprotein B n=1 Tax=Paenibacillus radicibacter TaxID=2972488 RepID=UPI0021598BC8|nr:kinase-associated lipoprotein B [Paenibacillus radicibacter]MCR8641351.1 kinase-associated lipoprotein B [Paenibacillus radicibacter]